MKQKWTHSGNKSLVPLQLELMHKDLAKKMASEGIVLLKNENFLPLAISQPLAVVGSGAGKTVKGGVGSGGVNSRENISIYRGLIESRANVITKDWIEEYEEHYQNARKQWKEKVLEEAKKVENPFNAYAANPFSLPIGRGITEKDIKGANAAVYVISRISGEGKDRRLEKGDYYLSETECADIRFLDNHQIPTVLIVNSGGPVELTDILEKMKNIRAILYISLPGQEGGAAVADILFGKTVPSGKLAATWARRYHDIPFADEFGYLNGNLETAEYKEGIYVGYRYFDSFCVKPLFAFGHGLSYTSFTISFDRITTENNRIKVFLKVRNTGDIYAGKEVVQVYISPQQRKVTQEYRRLAGFAKTRLLGPGESQELFVEIDQKQLAFFSEERQEWLIEAGSYGVWAGGSLESAGLLALLKVSESTVLEITNPICPRTAEFVELEMPADILRSSEESERSKQNQLPEYEFIPQEESHKAVYPVLADERYRTEDLIQLLYGNIRDNMSPACSAGTWVPGSAAETSENLENSYGLRSLILADGPAGLRLKKSYQVDQRTDRVCPAGDLASFEDDFLDMAEPYSHADTYYQFCTAFPVATAVAQTWNADLAEKMGRAVAEEMKEYQVNIWLAPGMNIQKNPLCGRNFEYFSEDPVLSGSMAAAITAGVQSLSGCAVAIKHFTCNNQEDNRMGVDSRVSEKALREIYLRGFEIAVKKSHPAAIMTSYNLVNGVHAANSYDLCTVLAREEWGFDGVIMSDWDTTTAEGGSVSWKCADAGNDIIMPGHMQDRDNIRKAYRAGILSEEKIRQSAGRMIALIQKLDGTE